MFSPTQERPGETGRRVQWDRDVNLLKGEVLRRSA